MNVESAKSVALIGMRGAGKSSVGRALAERLRSGFVDTDEVIAAEAGCSIAEIFAREGESGFRRRERETIARACQSLPRVLAVGGGAVIDERNTKVLKLHYRIVWLTAPAHVLWSRIAADPATEFTRPALPSACADNIPDGELGLERILAERRRLYQNAADLVMDTSTDRPEQLAQQIVTRLAIHT